MTRTTLIDFNPDENSQGLRYYPFMVNLDRCHENCKIPDLSGRTCVPNKTEDVNLSVFNLITRINESKTLSYHIYYIIYKIYIWKPSTCICESIIRNSVITCYKIIGVTKPITTKTTPTKTFPTKNALTNCSNKM